MPNPQTLVAFVTTLFVLLVATSVQLDLEPVTSTAVATVLALGLGWVVERRIPEEEIVEADQTSQKAGETNESDTPEY